VALSPACLASERKRGGVGKVAPRPSRRAPADARLLKGKGGKRGGVCSPGVSPSQARSRGEKKRGRLLFWITVRFAKKKEKRSPPRTAGFQALCRMGHEEEKREILACHDHHKKEEKGEEKGGPPAALLCTRSIPKGEKKKSSKMKAISPPALLGQKKTDAKTLTS